MVRTNVLARKHRKNHRHTNADTHTHLQLVVPGVAVLVSLLLPRLIGARGSTHKQVVARPVCGRETGRRVGGVAMGDGGDPTN